MASKGGLSDHRNRGKGTEEGSCAEFLQHDCARQNLHGLLARLHRLFLFLIQPEKPVSRIVDITAK